MISMILAIGPKYLIGNGNKLPWHSKLDFYHFKSFTDNKAIIMGDNTFFNLPKYPLKNRLNLVVSFNVKDTEYKDGYILFSSIEKAIEYGKKENKEIVICGGKGVYNYCLKNNLIDKIILSRISSNNLIKLANDNNMNNVYFNELEYYLKNSFLLKGKFKYSFESLENASKYIDNDLLVEFEEWNKN